MTNKFQHLKKHEKTNTVDEFIEQASDIIAIDEDNKKSSDSGGDILLSVSAKLNRHECEKPIQLYLDKNLAIKISKYTTGNKQATINYLLNEAVDKIIDVGELRVITKILGRS
jgi:DNA repair protein RadC